jgi:hypothetical protein
MAKIYWMKKLMDWFSRHWPPKNAGKPFGSRSSCNYKYSIYSWWQISSVKDVDVLLQNGAVSIHQFIGS